MRIRTIKPEFWRSDDIAALSLADRLLFVGIWSYVDDSGVGLDRLPHICADLFAPDLESDPLEVYGRVRGGLRNLAEAGLILRYSVDGKGYLYVTSWKLHQRIDKPTKSRYPSPTCTDAKISEPSSTAPEKVAPGAVEQGNRGTGEQGSENTSSPNAGNAPPPVSTDLAIRDDESNRPDVDRLCRHLADRIAANGSRPPTITAGWRTAARLMIDRDGRSEADAHAAIDWSQADPFWRSVILSMPKLRAKYDQLRLVAGRPANPARNGHASPGDRALALLAQTPEVS